MAVANVVGVSVRGAPKGCRTFPEEPELLLIDRFQEMAPRFAAIVSSIDTIVGINRDGAASSGATIQQLLENALNLVYVLCGISILVGTSAVAFAVAGIANPISRITAAMRNLASGDAQSQVPFSGRQDEIGAMAEGVASSSRLTISDAAMQASARCVSSASIATAECIENPHQAAILRDTGCDQFQGYLVGKPMRRDFQETDASRGCCMTPRGPETSREARSDFRTRRRMANGRWSCRCLCRARAPESTQQQVHRNGDLVDIGNVLRIAPGIELHYHLVPLHPVQVEMKMEVVTPHVA